METTDTPETDACHESMIYLRVDGTFRIDAMAEFARKLERQRNTLADRFTELDKPKYSGQPMLDNVLKTVNADFREWVATLPTTYWARYDLSAARISWEAACEFLQKAKNSKP